MLNGPCKWSYCYLSERVDSDSQENVEQCVVAKQGEEDEVARVDEAGASATLRLDAQVHDLVPILTSQDLKQFAVNYAFWPISIFSSG